MMKHLTLILLVQGLTAPTAAADPAKYKPIDAETIAAYQKLGTEYGGFQATRFGYGDFRPGLEAATSGLPGFRFGNLSHQQVPKLPTVSVPFGLDFNFTKTTDADLKQLKSLQI